MNNKLAHWFILSTFVGLYLVVSVISTVHVIEFFSLSNPSWLSISLAIAFEIGAAASLASLIIMEKMNKVMVWTLFIVLTAMQAMGNTYYSYINLHDFNSWSELFGLVEEDTIYQKRVLSLISGAILPFISLGFIKSLVDYIKPKESIEAKEESPSIVPLVEDSRDSVVYPEENQEPLDLKKEDIDSSEKLEEIPEEDFWKEEYENPSMETEPVEKKIEAKNKKQDSVWVNGNRPENLSSVEDPVLRYHYGISQQ